MVTEESGGKKVKMFLPIFAANIVSKITEKQAEKKGEKPVLTSFNVYSMAINNCFDSSKAKEELGWQAELTLEDMCRSSHNFIMSLRNKGE